ncbi:HDIG domain-containing metalloprotein [Desulfurivibrio alkaliphilus]|uniref:Polynucleotide adenylyltransferase/metal dependent phosphohydrolase n=1 Tax=Desulfurivibrio alkaliphilus (strain DSM 19089 / UNIQEM U267 / AHT2) TaxID=589865 RepID=D6Z386_DESAT|nr:HDIG domain-containing metalloprotein [Desulfurivibrio alkaliphilus]ADH86011.1 polynucleotide adenylyltransferase/metal dependent phosphohydrolase [Desulfurivibrio alkaliphilus AHT 2]
MDPATGCNFAQGRLEAALQEVLRRRGAPPLYLAGGALRDWLVGGSRPAVEAAAGLGRDLDFTLPAGAVAFARDLAGELGGTLVVLDREHDVARLVWQGRELDFAAFREGAASIEEDLRRRDFTINAMAWRLNPAGEPVALPSAASVKAAAPGRLLDPCDGLADLQAGVIRVTGPNAFAADPLRLLRAYRFQASLRFALDPATDKLISSNALMIDTVAAERIVAELDATLAACGAATALAAMAASGLLYRVLPELAAGCGVAQPDSHHLDVAGHCHETLAQLQVVLADPARFFPDSHQHLTPYFTGARCFQRDIALRWAALLHDLGKPATGGRRGERLTFYHHDRVGAEICGRLARRLRLSRWRRTLLQLLVRHHMWPFHLNNARRRTGIKPRACLRLVRALGEDLPALFFLAMADSLAGRGPGKPPAMERELASLHAEVMRVAEEQLAPVLQQPPLLNGHDLQQLLGLTPGPWFKKILAGLEQARVEGAVCTRQEALAWVRNFVTVQQIS